jgi:two-component system sensor kinase FixL
VPPDSDPPPPIGTVSEARLASVLDTAVDGIIVIDECARILRFNKACERLFGYTVDEVLGQNVRLIMPSDYAGAHDGYVQNYLSTGTRKIIGIGREVRGRHRNGEEFPVELSVGEAQTPEGRQFIGIMRDLRSRKETERRVAELQADLVHMARVSAMDEMGAALAHELNQPLTAIMLYLRAGTRAIEQGRNDKSDALLKTVIDKAVHEAERAGSIISQMRQFVEKREPHRRFVDLNAVVDEAVELTLHGARDKVKVIRRYATNPRPAFVEPVQIQQIIVNLIRNAIEAMRGQADAFVTVTTTVQRDVLTVSVADSGPGIPAEAVGGLFKAFSTSKRSGMGLGLSISRTIAQSHGGDLLVDPGGQGRGAKFTLVLQVDDNDVPPDGADSLQIRTRAVGSPFSK